jgi:hypothetical protein
VTGRFRPLQHRSDAESFIERLKSLHRVGSGYAEVSRVGQQFPLLALSFSGDNSVVHHFTSAERSLLLRGDRSVSGGHVVEVPIFEEVHTFLGDHVSTAHRACQVVKDFLAGVSPESLGEWDER